MVSSTLVDTLASPANALNELFRVNNAKDGLPDFPKAVKAHFESVFKEDNAFSQIPTLSKAQPRSVHGPRAIVRFRAMVQDTSPSPELYLPKLKNGACGGWGIAEDMSAESLSDDDYDGLQERSILWAASIPGEAEWSVQDEAPSNDGPSCATQSVPADLRYKYPLIGDRHVVAQIKIYDSSGDALKPTEIADFVGILTDEPGPFVDENESDTSSLVPTLHVLFYRRLPKTIEEHAYPLPSPPPSSGCSSTAEIREHIISWIAKEALGGDHVAAEWILLSCIAKVQSRNPPVLPPVFALSKFSAPPEKLEDQNQTQTPALAHILSDILPLFSTLPLALKNINEWNFAPESKDEDLHAGVLQLPASSLVLVSELGMQTGTVNEKGVRNLQTLQEVMKHQTLKYVFPFSHFSFPTDISFIVLAEGKKSTFCETTVEIPLQPSTSADLFKDRASITPPSPEMLSLFRQYIISAKSGDVSVNDETSQHIQDEFVEERKKDKSITPDDLVHRLTVARLLTLSLHEKEITKAIWQRTLELDSQRRARLSVS